MHQRVYTADALIIFFDSDQVVNPDSKYTARMRRLISFMQKATADLDEDKLFPVSIVITKSDKHDSDTIFDSKGFKLAGKLLEIISPSKNIAGMLTLTEISDKAISNVHFPLLFSMLYSILNKKMEKETEIEELASSYKNYSNRANIIDDVFSFISSTSSYTDLARAKYNAAHAEYEKYEEVTSSLEKVTKILEDADGNSILTF